MFVKELSLHEFRGVRKTAEPLKLKRLNVLIGRNNAGKTTVLEALALLPHPESPMSWFEQRHARVASLHGNKPNALVYKYAGEATIAYTLERDVRLKVQVTAGGGSALYWEGEAASLSWGTLEGKLKEVGLIKSPRGEDTIIFIPCSDSFIARLEAKLYEKQDLVVKTGAHYRIVRDVVNKCVDEVFTETLFTEKELRLRKEPSCGPPYYVRLKDMGDGLERAISVLLWLEAVRPMLVLWDDFESNMHPSLIKAVLAWLAERDWQVVLATHSLDVLYALPDVWPEGEAQLIMLQKTDDDLLRADYMSVEELEHVLDETNQDPRYLVEWLKL